MPAYVEIFPGKVRKYSRTTPGRGIILSRTIDDDLEPKRWGLIYVDTRPEVGDALRRHWNDWKGSVFEWTPPGAASPETVRYFEAPTIRNVRNKTNARVAVERALAHE
jgi:hypothetical protein